jgi:SPP1 gp7 family putative phage head morphogenesis protein
MELPIDSEKYPYMEEPVNQFGESYPNTGKEEEEKEEEKPEKTIKALSMDAKEDRLKFSDDYIERILKPGEKQFVKTIVEHFRAQRNAMQDLVDEWVAKSADKKTITKAVDIEPDMFMLEEDAEYQKLLKEYTPFVKDQMKREVSKLKEEFGHDIGWKVTDKKVFAFVDKRRADLKGIEKLTFKKYEDNISDIIAKGQKENWTVQEYAREIKSEISRVAGVRLNNATTIARTETGMVSSSTRYSAFKEEGVEKHQWISSRDEKVRPEHDAEDGNIVELGKPFPVTGLTHPQDPKGEAEQVINCRCVSIFAREKDE